jgi:hypothetical protein
MTMDSSRWVNLCTCGAEMAGSVLEVSLTAVSSLKKNSFGFSFIFGISHYIVFGTHKMYDEMFQRN